MTVTPKGSAQATHASAITTGDGCRIAYRVEGNPAAPVLMLSNSLGTTMSMWDAQMSLFTRSHRVLRYDSRGHGESGNPAGAYSIDRLVRDAIELLDALDIPEVDFCGLSKGGMVGQGLGWRAPDRLRHLVLANTSAFLGPPEGWQVRIERVLKAGLEAIAEAVIGRWFTPEFVRSGNEAIELIRQQLLDTSPLGYAGCCAAIRDMDQRSLCSVIRAPTLVIGGTRDPATPPGHAEFLARSIPNASLQMLEAAHLSNVEQAERFGRVVCAFLGN